MKPAALLALALAACSNPSVPADPIGGLIRGLRSDDIEERDHAEAGLRQAGAAAIPALKKAENDPDSEVRARAARILDSLDPSRNPAPLDPSLLLRLDREGVVTCGGKEVARCGEADHVKKFEAFFEGHRARVKRETGLDKYPLEIRTAPDAPFEHVQAILMVATHHGGVTRVRLEKK